MEDIRSPMNGSAETHSSDDEDEDMDEDLLYLRLIALRSLEEVSKPDYEIEDTVENKLAVEMKELLEEAEVAAKEVSECGETAVISEVITIDDEDDDDPITEMKLNLHETYLKYKESVDLSSPSSVVITSPSSSSSSCLLPISSSSPTTPLTLSSPTSRASANDFIVETWRTFASWRRP